MNEEDCQLVKSIVERKYKFFPIGFSKDDAISIGYLAIKKAKETYDASKGSWDHYLQWRVQDEVRTQLKHWSRFSHASFETEDNVLIENYSTNNLEQAFEEFLIKEEFKYILQQLPPRQKLAIDLYYYQNINRKDIARQLKISESGLQQLLDRARNNIKINYELLIDNKKEIKTQTKIVVDHKKCTKCHNTYPAASFYKSKRERDNLYPQCKMCCKLYQTSEKVKKFRRERKVRAKKNNHLTG